MNKGNGRKCQVCSKTLRGRQLVHCSDKCANKGNRNIDKERERYARWFAANKEKRMAQIATWRAANRHLQREYMRRYRNSETCAYCGSPRFLTADSCRDCSRRYGCICHDNPACGVKGPHKNCPCGEPLRRQKAQYQIEACAMCREEMRRGGLTFVELFERGQRKEKAA